MKVRYIAGFFLAGMLSVLAGRAMASEQYLVAYENDYQGKERYLVMNETNFNVRSKEVAAEVGLLAKAKLAARNVWADEERERVKKLRDEKMKADAKNANKAGANALSVSKEDKIKYNSFPHLEINMNPEVTCMGKFGTQAEAEERCKKLAQVLEERNAAKAAGAKTIMRMDDKLPSSLKKPSSDGKKNGGSKREVEENADVEKAMALFEKCLGEVRNAPAKEEKAVVEPATFEKGMRDTRQKVKAMGM